MFDLYHDHDPLTPTGGTLLAEMGIDPDAVRRTLADDRARRCPDREAPTDERWRKASEK